MHSDGEAIDDAGAVCEGVLSSENKLSCIGNKSKCSMEKSENSESTRF